MVYGAIKDIAFDIGYGLVIDVNKEPEKAYLSIEVTPSGMS